MIRQVYEELLWTPRHEPRYFHNPYRASGENWEQMKRGMVHYVAERFGLAEPEGESLSKPTEPDANQNDPIFQVSSVASANDCTGIAVTVPNDDFEANSVAHLAPVNVTSKESGK